jgi:bifunctional non-homologous end joining protein LigD
MRQQPKCQRRHGEHPSVPPDAADPVPEPFQRDGWVYEEKIDGWRILAYKDHERVRLISRNGRNHTRRFRDIAAAISLLRRVELARCA